MIQPENDFCFCTLALGEKYRFLAQNLARDIAQYSPGTFFVILTDRPQDFKDEQNILAFEHHQQGILKCFHDRRFVIAKSLSLFRVAIHIDSDTKLVGNVPQYQWLPGLTSGEYRNIVKHAQNQRSPHRQMLIQALAAKLGVSLEVVNHVEESLFVIARDGGKELEFIRQWDRIGRSLEMNGIHEGDGNAIGLAAAKVGWTIRSEGWEGLSQVREHIGITWNKQNLQPLTLSRVAKIRNFFESQKRRIGYHYRLNKARLIALQDFDFYYR
ncbi:MAG: hypothetical protein ACM37W_20655 [Actinomycetota bacterium]